MDNGHNRTATILDEHDQWRRYQNFVTGYGLFLGSPKIARNMVAVINAVQTASEDCEDSLLGTFLESARALRAVFQRAMKTIGSTVSARTSHDLDFRDIEDMIRSDKDWQKKERDLVHAIGQVRKRAKDLRHRNSLHILSLFNSVVHMREGNNTVLKDITEKIRCAYTSFESSSSMDIEECITRIANLKHRKDQFRLAEDSAQIIEGVLRGVGIQHTADQAQPDPHIHIVGNVLADIDQWLSGSKHVYFLWGEAGAGKSPIASALCARLRSGKYPTAKLCASFFFPHDIGPLTSLRFAISSLFSQLSSKDSSEISAVLHEHLYRGDPAEQLLHDALEAMCTDDQIPSVLVIDAVDLCKDSSEVPHLLRCLLAYVREFPWLRIFFSSRPRPNVMAVLAHPSHADTVHLHQLDGGHDTWNGDVRRYLEYVVPRIPGYSDYLRTHPRSLRRLIRHAGKNFDFARMAARYLDTDHSQPQTLFASLLKKQRDDLSLLIALYLREKGLYSVPSPAHPRGTMPWTYIRIVLRFTAYGMRGLTPELISEHTYDTCADDIILAVDHLRVGLKINEHAEIVPHDSSFHNFLFALQHDRDKAREYQMDFNTHLASISIAELSMAHPVTAILQARLPSTLLPHINNHHPQTPLLSRWSSYLSNYAPRWAGNSDFLHQFYWQFLDSLQLAMYAWVTEPVDVHRTAGVLAQYSQWLRWDAYDHGIISRFHTFATYVQLCRERRDQDISATDVIQAIAEGRRDASVSRDSDVVQDSAELTTTMLFEHQKRSGTIKLPVDRLEKYRSTMDEFLRQLRDSTSEADELNAPGLLEGTFRIAD